MWDVPGLGCTTTGGTSALLCRAARCQQLPLRLLLPPSCTFLPPAAAVVFQMHYQELLARNDEIAQLKAQLAAHGAGVAAAAVPAVQPPPPPSHSGGAAPGPAAHGGVAGSSEADDLF